MNLKLGDIVRTREGKLGIFLKHEIHLGSDRSLILINGVAQSRRSCTLLILNRDSKN